MQHEVPKSCGHVSMQRCIVYRHQPLSVLILISLASGTARTGTVLISALAIQAITAGSLGSHRPPWPSYNRACPSSGMIPDNPVTCALLQLKTKPVGSKYQYLAADPSQAGAQACFIFLRVSSNSTAGER